MLNYILKRMLLMVPTLVGVLTFTFVISEFVPGGPMDQIIVMLKHKTGQGEVAQAQSNHADKVSLSDVQEKMKLARTYNLHQSRLDRFLKTFIWFSQDSITSSEEVNNNGTIKFIYNKRDGILLRKDNAYYAYYNRYENDDQREDVVFDRDKQSFRSTVSNTLINYKTGKSLNGIDALEIIPIDIKDEASRYHILKHIIGETAYQSQNLGAQTSRQEIYIRESFVESFGNWKNWHGLFLLKFGDSIRLNDPVTTLIVDRLPVSISLGVFSFFITYTICIILGISKAVRHGTRFDGISSIFVLIGYSTPGFVLGVLILALFGPNGTVGSFLPQMGLSSSGVAGYEEWSLIAKVFDYFKHLFAPMICLCIGSFAVLTFLTKNSILDQFHQLYAVAARARGLSERKVLYKHILRNSLIPLVTGFPSSFLAMFFTGSLLIERVFQLHGLGMLSLDSVLGRDFPVVMGSLFIFTIIGLIGALLTDICYVIVDPRISFDKQSTG